MTKILIDRAVVEQALHVATGAGYPVALIAALKAALAEPVQEPGNGGRTGWPPGLLQDDCRGLSKWLASRPDARQRLREALAEPVPPIGKASTDVGVPVYVLKKAEPPCNPSCAPGYCYCDGIKEGT